MPRSPDFFRSLNEQLLEQLEEYTRQPGVTGDEVCDWLAGKGIQASRSAVYRWRQDFLLEDRTRRASELATAFVAAKSGVDISDAAFGVVSQHIFQMATGDELDADSIGKLSLALQRLTLGKKRIEEVKAEMESRQRMAIDEAVKVKDSGGTADAVVDKVREILGMNQ